MPAATHNLLIEQGSDFSVIFQYLDNTSNPIDISKYCIRLRFRDSDNFSRVGLYSSNTANAAYTLRSTSIGQIEWTLPYTETSTFDFNNALYDLELIDENNERIRICTGSIQILKNNFSDCDEENPNSIASGWCSSCGDITVADSWGKVINSNIYMPPHLQDEELCSYLCRGMDVFSKLYTTKNNLFAINGITSGNITAYSGQTIFEIPINYVANSLHLKLNDSGLFRGINFVTNTPNVELVNLNIQSGDVLSWIHTGLSIPDDSYTACGIHVPDSGNITNIEVTIGNLKHTNPQDLSLMLLAPSGDPILLSAYNKINNYSSYSGLNFTFSNKANINTYLNNRNTEDLFVNILDKTNSFKMSENIYVSPETETFPSRVISSGAKLSASLASLTGISAYGNWFLVVNDHDLGVSGTIDAWNLVLTYQPNISILE